MKKNQLKIGVILSYTIIVLNMVIGLLYTPVLVKMLGKSEYGLYSLVYSVISYLTVLDFGFGNAIIIYTARYRAKNLKEEENRLHGMFLVIYSVIGVIATIGGIVLYLNVENLFGKTMTSSEISTAKTLMSVLIVNLAVTFPFSIFSSIITAYEKFVFSKVMNIVRILIIPCTMLPLLLMGYKSVALVTVMTIVNVAVLLLNMFYCFKKIKIKLLFGKFNIPLLKEISGYSFFIFLNMIIDKVNWSLDQFILGSVVGTAAVAVYSVSSQLNQMYLAFSTAISGVLLPKITKMEERKASNKEFTDIFIKTSRLQYLVLAIIVMGFVIFGQEFINIWVGNSYRDSYYIACILMIPLTIPLTQNIGLSILQAKNKYKYRTMIFFGISIVNVTLSIILSKMYGGIGAAIGTSIALILGQILILNIYYHKAIRINMIRYWKEIFKMSIPIIAVFVICFIMNTFWSANGIIVLGMQIIITVVLYLITIWFFVANKYEKSIVTKIVNKIIKKKNINVQQSI